MWALLCVLLVCVVCVEASVMLPEDTQPHFSTHSYHGDIYYRNDVTGETSWNVLEGSKVAPVEGCGEHSSNFPISNSASFVTAHLQESSMGFHANLRKAWEKFDENSITLTLHSDTKRISSGALNRIATQWKGPISAAIIASSKQELLDALEASSNADVKQWANVHLVETKLKWKHYPYNKMRNFALKPATTKYIMVLDIDEDIPFTMQEHLEQLNRAHPEQYFKAIFMMPSFQWATNNPPTRDVPRTVGQLTRLFEQGQATIKHPAFTPAYQIPNMDFWKWSSITEATEVEYRDSFEPYFIALRNSIPLYDERFEGFGGDKSSHTLRLALSDYHILVLPKLFMWSNETPGEIKHRLPANPDLIRQAWQELGSSLGCDSCCIECCQKNCPQLFNKHIRQAKKIALPSTEHSTALEKNVEQPKSVPQVAQVPQPVAQVPQVPQVIQVQPVPQVQQVQPVPQAPPVPQVQQPVPQVAPVNPSQQQTTQQQF
eukprot:c7581_g1_i1.p1 GENE.c7581_g1_i1~~c7581_g1_i1.p1  ORF type:complete len:521 (+),score=106.12 c7581_g1_i1:97-1563(+)